MKVILLLAIVVLICQFSSSSALNPKDLKEVIQILGEEFKMLKPILENKNKVLQEAAEQEAWNCKEPATKPIVLYDFAQETLVLLSTRVRYLDTNQTKITAFKETIKTDCEFLNNWFDGTDVTSLGVAWRIYSPYSADKSGIKYYQFFFTTKNRDQKFILQKGANEFRTAINEIHTELRQRHNSFPMTLIDDAAEKKKGVSLGANEYADHLIKTGAFEHSADSDRKCGENLATCSGSGALVFGASAAEFSSFGWYDEINHYDIEMVNESMVQQFGHFTQMVWKESNELSPSVSYGIKTIDGVQFNNMVVVARYYVKGNLFAYEDETKEFFKNVELLYKP